MKQLRLLLATLCLVGVTVVPLAASADVNDFTVTNFSADETLTRDDPQGELHIIEHINVSFTDYNHGILRAIPDRYKNHSLQLHVNGITSDTNAPTEHTTYGSNGNTVLKIGSPNQTVTGAQEYTIDYTLHNVISFYKDHDELYWDVNGDQWQQPFSKVSVVLHLPPELKQTQKPLCYAGSYGSNSQNCLLTSDGQTVQAQTTTPLSANQTLTYVAGFEKDYFQPSPWYQTLAEYLKPLLEFLIPVVLLGGGSLFYWWTRGRDPKGSGIIIPQYDAPDGLKPLAVDAIAAFKVTNKAITATIIDLAVRGYLKIIESKQAKVLRKDKLSYTLQLVNSDFSKLDANETLVMTALFSGQKSGALVDVSALKNSLYTTAKTLNQHVTDQLVTDGYFRSSPLSAGKGLIGLGIALIGIVYLGGALLGPAGIAGCIVAGVIVAVCALAAAARTKQGVAAKEHIEGLKLYLDVAEKERINKLQAPDAKYAASASEPVKTVELFEKLLPYAMVLGVEKGWAQQFEGLYTTPPGWYSGNWSTFNAYYLASSLNDGIGSAVNTAFTAPSSSGSSGFGGGGFSGGGGGGGGGGGW